jgi:cholesterol transport system auxiliary component
MANRRDKKDRGNKMRINFILTILLCCIISACSHHPSPKQYTLQLDYLHIPCGCTTDKTLLVLPTRAAADMQSENMLYSTQKNELASFTKHEWTANPAKLMTTLIVEAVERSHHFCAVVAAPFPGLVDYRLSTRLIRLYQDFTRCPSHVVLQLDAAVSNAKSGRLIAAKTFKVDVIAPSNTPYGGVVATNQASRILMQQLVMFLACTTEVNVITEVKEITEIKEAIKHTKEQNEKGSLGASTDSIHNIKNPASKPETDQKVEPPLLKNEQIESEEIKIKK